MEFSSETIAFVGLGVMGYPMALNLSKGLHKSHTLFICDVVPDALQRFRADTADLGPVQVVENGIGRGEEVYLDNATGILAGAEKLEHERKSQQHKIIMECGTIETATILEVAKATEASSASKRLIFVDAPISGGPTGAQDGTLTFMEDAVFLCGNVGAGTAFKVTNTYLSAITSLAVSEALNIGAKMNLDLKLLTDVINVSGGQCWVTSKSNPVPGNQPDVPSSREYEGGFRIELCSKELKMESDLAEMEGARTSLDKPTLKAFAEAQADGRYKGKGTRVVYKWLNESEREMIE